MACMPRESEVFRGYFSQGTNWDDRIPDHSPAIVGIHRIRIRHGDHVDAIQVTYRLSDGSTYTAPMHGGTGGRLSSFTLAGDESIIRIEGKARIFVDQVTFVTRNSTMYERRYGPYGQIAQNVFSFDGYVMGFFGRAGHLLDGIGVYYLPITTGILT